MPRIDEQRVANVLAILRGSPAQACAAEKPRHSQAPDILGQRFGQLTVIARLPNRRYANSIQSLWRAMCDCGELVSRSGIGLRFGKAVRCKACSIRASVATKRENAGRKNRS